MIRSARLRRWIIGPLLTLAVVRAAPPAPADADARVKDGLAAEAKLNSRGALECFLAANQARPNDAFVIQKIARQYSDLIVDLTNDEDRKHYAEIALSYSRRSVELDPRNAVNVLSVAVCLGKLAIYSDTRTKIQNSRLVKEGAERALALDPHYAWAHHLLGRWNYEVATLGGATRFFVHVIYGGLPDASTAQGVTELSRAVELEPGELAHQLELGFAFLADGQKPRARAQFEKGLAMPSRGKHDEVAKARAREALEKLARAFS